MTYINILCGRETQNILVLEQVVYTSIYYYEFKG
jgi:hypothetical protein